MNDHDCDVIVIGAGPIGLTLAGLLAESGVRVTVVESRSEAGDLPRAISIVDETFRTLDALGVADALKAESNLDTGSRYFGRNDVLLAASKPAPSKLGHPAKSQFDQPVLEALLWDRTVDDDRIDFLHGTAATAIRQDTTGITVTVDADGGATRDLRAAWLVGCDGGRSFTRDALDIALVGSTQVEKWIVVDLEGVAESFEPYADFHADGERPVVVVPGIKGRLRFEFMLLPGDDERTVTSFESVRELCRPFTEVREQQVRRSSVYVAHQRLAAHYRKARAFLAGDAAHLMPPFAGQGLNAGIRDAANLAWKLAEAVHGRATQRLLDSYEAERRPHAADMVRISHRIGQVVMTTGRARAQARDLAFRSLSSVPRAKAFLAGMKFIAPPNYVKGGCVVAPRADVAPSIAALVGRALPQPTVRDAEGDEFGLDRLLRGGWRLIAIGGDLGIDPFRGLAREWAAIEQEPRVVLRRRDTLLGPVAPGTPYREVVDVSGHLASRANALATTHLLLVRPDAYVAAAFTLDSQAEALAGMRAYLTLDPSTTN